MPDVPALAPVESPSPWLRSDAAMVMPVVPAYPNGFDGTRRRGDGTPVDATNALGSFESWRDLEARFTGRALAWIGGLALVLGAVFFLSLAFSRGWIGPTERVVIALVAGAVMVAAGAASFERRSPALGHVLVAAGLATFSLGLFAGTRLYDVFGPEVALVGSLVAASVAAAIAIRARSQTVAALGLVSILAAPPVLGAPANLLTVAFLGIAIVATVVAAVVRDWRYLSRIALLLTAPQLVAWAGGADPVQEMIVVLAYWGAFAIASSGPEMGGSPASLHRYAAWFLVCTTGVALAAGLLGTRHAPGESAALFVVLLAAAHLVPGGLILRSRGSAYPYGLLLGGLGAALVAFAIGLRFHGPDVVMWWTVEAVALAAASRRMRSPWAAAAACCVGALAIAHLVAFAYPLRDFSLLGTAGGTSFLDPSGLALAFVIGGLLAGAALAWRPGWRSGLVAGSILVALYAAPFGTSDMLLLAAWAVAFPASIAIGAILERHDGPVALLRTATEGPRTAGPTVILMAPAVAGIGLAACELVAVQLPTSALGSIVLPRVPFVDAATVAAVCVAIALLVGARLTPYGAVRVASIIGAAVVAGYLAVFEVPSAFVVAAWCALAVVLGAWSERDVHWRDWYLGAAGAAVVAAAALCLSRVVPPSRLAVEPNVSVSLAFAADACVAIVSIVVALAVAARRGWVARLTPWLVAAAGAALLYLASTLLVAAFQSRAGGDVALEELQKQAQVALSILWAAVGFGALAAGIATARQTVREAGLAVLALATVKVFLFDLSSLDVAYRVLSLVGLGILLLLGAFAYQRIRPRTGGRGGTAVVH